MGKGTTNAWKIVLQIALAVMLIIGGLNVFSNGTWFGRDELVKAVTSFTTNVFHNRTVSNVVAYVLAVIEIICGVLLILDLFKLKSLDKLDDIFMWIILLLWLVCVVVLKDIVPIFNNGIKKLNLVELAKDLVILASFGIIKAKI